MATEKCAVTSAPLSSRQITIDNSQHTEQAFAFFGIGNDAALRPLSDNNSGLCGIARANQWGFAVVPEGGQAREILSDDIFAAITNGTQLADHTLPPARERLSKRGGVLLTVLPGEKRTYTLALGFYRSGIVTTGIAATYLYSRLFSDLDTVLDFAAENAPYYLALCAERNRELDNAVLSDERKFLLAHATHSYHGATLLLDDVRGVVPVAPRLAAPSLHHPLWAVSETKHRLLNALDLTIDQAFFELQFHSWTLRNTLDLFVARYSYSDEVQDATANERPHFPGGTAFTHDMGAANQFSPPGQSAYERPDMSGPFSYMTQEQLCNWCLCAALYGLPTLFSDGDLLWLAARRSILRACLVSLQHRDGPEPLQNGLMSFDSARCGKGQEVTTYDIFADSLSRARGNAYLAVKTWAAYLALSRCFDVLGEQGKAVEAEEQAAQAAATIAVQWDEAAEYIPALFADGSDGEMARVLPMIEALAYPYLWDDEDAVSPFGRYGQMVSELRRHLKAALLPGACVNAKSGGLRLSSLSDTTWMSKLFLAQFVAERVLGLTLAPEIDAVHAAWQRDSSCQNFAFTDEVDAGSGEALGAFCYPRGVTSILWML